MCFFNFVEYGIQTIRSIIGCICCLTITGPLLLIIGVVMLVSPNNYAQMVSDYNAGWTTFQSGDMNVMLNTSGYIPVQSVSLTASSSAMTITGDGVTPGIVSVPLASVGSVYVASGYSITLTGSAASVLTMPSYSNTATSKSFSARCNTGSSSSSSNSYCSSYDMQTYCNSNSPSGCSYTYVSNGFSSCRNGDTCGTCQGYQVTSSLCYVITRASGTWQRSTSKTTCRYSDGLWNTQPTSCQSGSGSGSSYLTVTLLSDQDPRIVLETTTKGSNSFGLTAAQQRLTGLAMMVIGGLLTAGVIGVCVLLCRALTDHGHKQRVYGAFGMQYTPPVGYQPYQPQPTYAAQPSYPPQQAAYPPQPGYGYAPQPGYPPQQQQLQYPPQPGYPPRPY